MWSFKIKFASYFFLLIIGLFGCVALTFAAQGDITTVAGTGENGFSGDGGLATEAQLHLSTGVFVDDAGNLFIADTLNNYIRRVDGQTGIITTVAGTGEEGFLWGRTGERRRQRSTSSVFMDGAGNFFVVAESIHLIRRVDGQTGIITTVAGTGESGFSGDGGLATEAQLDRPNGVFVDRAGNLFTADRLNNRIRRVDGQTGIITTVAGTGESGFSGDGGLATEAQLDEPYDVFVDGAGNLFIADALNNRIRRVDGQTGIITTVAGTGERGFSGDGGLATEAQLSLPLDVFVDSAGSLFIIDWLNNRIRRVDGQTGIITTVAGTGKRGFSGDGGPATEAQLDDPDDVFVDGTGNLFIADRLDYRIRRVEDIAAPTSLDIGVFNPGGDSPPQVAEDVTGDGQVNIFDLVQVAAQFGQSGENLSGDVNGDGQVNIFDLVLIGLAFG